MTDDEAKEFLLTAYDQFIRKAPDQQTLDRYFTDDFTSYSDGAVMDRHQFESHLSVLHSELRSFSVRFEQIITAEDRIAAILLIDFEKTDGAKSKVKVYVFYELRDGKLCAIDEITRLISGDPEGRDLVRRSQ